MRLKKSFGSVGVIPFILMAILLALVVTSQTFAHDSSPGKGVIHSCVNSSSGELKLVDATETCKKNHDGVDWNIQGIQGVKGDTGKTGPIGKTGLTGKAGAAGFNCWDLNQNGVGDPHAPPYGEDVNGDGKVDVNDCTGLTGKPGRTGKTGAPGLNCWDLNENGVKDPKVLHGYGYFEDVNRDFKVDVNDCTGLTGKTGPPGKTGAPGLNCWDLNGNGVRDPKPAPSGEDVNGDGKVDVNDCTGPTGKQGPKGDSGPQGIQGPQGNAADRVAVKNVDGSTSTYLVSTGRYHVESTKANEGRSLPLDMTIVREFCQDEDGCSVTIGMRDWADSQPGNVASRGPSKLFMSESSDWWRSNPSAGFGANSDQAGNDGDGAFTGHVAQAWACCMTELEYTDFVWVDEEVGFSLLNWTGGFGAFYPDPDMVCVLDIED